MPTRSAYHSVFLALLLLLVTRCNGISVPQSVRNATPTIIASTDSTIMFTLSGGNNGNYAIHASLPTSKLRHGHREFTIYVEQAGISVFLAFYGYRGPATYTLAQNINGGDIHIGLGKDAPSWDLSLQLAAHCTMTVQSDIPTSQAGLDRMRGSFSCPLLFSSAPNHPANPVSVRNGSFDIAIIVES